MPERAAPTLEEATPDERLEAVETSLAATSVELEPTTEAGEAELTERPSDADAAAEPPRNDAASAGESAGQVALAIIRAHFDLLRAHEPVVERADDPEALHDLRVDIRRLRAAIGFFTDALPTRAAGLRDRLGQLGVVLGALRDLDVLSARLAAWIAGASGGERDALELAAARIDDRRRQARRRAVSALTSQRTRMMFASLDRLLASGPPRKSSTARIPILALAPELLTQAHRELVVLGDAIGPDSPADALHSVRIRCKRLRYAVDSFKPWYGKPSRRYAERLVGLEDVLGTHQDAVVAAGALADIGLGPRRRLAPEQLFTLGALAERCQEQARVAGRLFPTHFARVSGRRWRRLVRAMEDARPSPS